MRKGLLLLIVLCAVSLVATASDSVRYKYLKRVVKQLKPMPEPVLLADGVIAGSLAVSYAQGMKLLIGVDSVGDAFAINPGFEKAGKAWTLNPNPEGRYLFPNTGKNILALPGAVRLKDSMLMGIQSSTRADQAYEDRVLKQASAGVFSNEQWAEPLPGHTSLRRNVVQDPWTGRLFYLSVSRPPGDSGKYVATIMEMNTRWKSRRFANNLLEKAINVSDLAATTTPDGRLVLFAFTEMGLRLYITAKNYLQHPAEFLACPGGNCFMGDNPVFREIELPDYVKKIKEVVPASLQLVRIVGRSHMGVLLSAGVKNRRHTQYISLPMYVEYDADAKETMLPGSAIITSAGKQGPLNFESQGPQPGDYGRSLYALRGAYQTWIAGSKVHYRLLHENGTMVQGVLNKPSDGGLPRNLHSDCFRLGDSVAFISLWNEGSELMANLLAVVADTLVERVKIEKTPKPDDYDFYSENDRREEPVMDIAGGFFSTRYQLENAPAGTIELKPSAAVPVTFLLGKMWNNRYWVSGGYSVYTFYQRVAIAIGGVGQQHELSFVRVSQFPLLAGYRYTFPSPRWHVGGQAGVQLLRFNALVSQSQRQTTKASAPLNYRSGYSRMLKLQPLLGVCGEYSLYKRLAITATAAYLMPANGLLQTIIYDSANKPGFLYHTRLQGFLFAAGIRLYPAR